MLLPLLAQLRVTRPVGRPRTRPAAVLGDKAYSSRAIRTHLRARGIKAVIPEPADQQGHRRRRGARGGRPVSLDADAYKGRNVIERQYAHLKQWRGLATRYDKYAIIYRAALVLNAVLAWSKRLSDMPYLRITNETLGRLSNKQVALDFDFRLSDEAAACGVRTGSVSSTSNGGTSRIALNNGKTYNATNGLAVPANGSVGRTDGTCRLGLDRTEACGTTGQSPYSVAGSTGASSTAVTAISLYRSITVSGYGTTVVYLNATGVGTNLSVSAAPLI